MAEDTGTPQDPSPAEDNRIPYDRFKAANDKAKTLERDLAEMRSRLEERDDAEKSDVERLTKRAEAAEAKITAAEGRVVELERGGWIRTAAEKAGFIDSTDALSRARLGELDTEADAQAFVKQLAKDAKHLIAPKDDRPGVERVLQGGQPVDDKPTGPAGPNEADQTLLAQIKAQADSAGWTEVPFG